MSTSTIVYIVTEDTGNEEIQAQVLVGEGVVPTSVELRLCASSDSTVLQSRVVGGLTSTVAVLVEYIVLRTSVHGTCILIGVECTESLALHDALGPAVSRDTCHHRVTSCEIGGMELFVLHLVDSILVVSQVDAGHPVEILRADGIDVQSQLDTLVGHLTDIGIHLTINILCRRNRIFPNQVFSLLVVNLDSTVDAILQESEVKTDVQHACGLPLQVGISILGRTIEAIVFTIVYKWTSSTIGVV